MGNVTNSKDFLADFIIFDAVLRELQIVGEATNNLIKNEILDDTHRNIVDFRNRITHEYFGVDHDIVWDVVQHDIPILVDTIGRVIHSSPSRPYVLEALECAANDHKRAGQLIVVEFLVNYRNNILSL